MNINKVKVGSIFNGYQDGKLTRQVKIKILEKVKRTEVIEECWKMWMSAIDKDFKDVKWQLEKLYDSNRPDVFGGNCFNECFWDWNNKYFLFGVIVGDEETEKDPIMFAKRQNGGKSGVWYGVNWNYSLDLDNKEFILSK